MTKRDIVLKIANDKENINSKDGLTQIQIKEVVQKTLDCISEELAAGKHIELRNFGVFKVAVNRERKGRNPRKPGSEMIIPKNTVVRFKPGIKLKNKINTIKISDIN